MPTLVFDVNGTLSDLSAAGRLFASAGAPAELAPTWFAAVLRDGIALTSVDAALPFTDVAEAVLRSELAGRLSPGRDLDDAVATIMSGFAQLPPHPDVVPGITRLATRGQRMIALTNGSVATADALLSGAGVRDSFAALLSVDAAGAWKPDPRAYELAVRECGLDAGDLMLVAVHPWDVDGAHRAGLRTAWIDRVGVPYPSVFSAPELTARDLVELAELL